MKKAIFVFIGIVIAAALYFCFTVVYANCQVHKFFTSEMSYFDRFGAKYELIEQQRGLFRSIYKTKLSVIISPDITLDTVIESRAKFGVRDSDIFKIGSMDISYEYNDDMKNMFNNNTFDYIVNNTKNVVMNIRFDGITNKMKIGSQSFEFGLDFAGAAREFTYSVGAYTQDIKTSFDAKNIVLNQYIEEMTQNDTLNFVEIKGLSYDIDLNKNKLGTWLGFIKGTAKKYDTRFYEFVAGSFTNYTTNVVFDEQDGGLMSMNFKVGADEFVAVGDEFDFIMKDAVINITVSQLKQNSINTIVNKLSKINLAMEDSKKRIILSSVVTDMLSLLESNPTISFNFAGSFNGSKTNGISGYIKYISDSAYGISLFNWQEYLDFELEYSIDKEMFVSLLKKYESTKGYKSGYSFSDEEISRLGEKYLLNFQKIGANIDGDMITGVINKNTKFLPFN
ncbi:MAG: YdgA family protein [Campylobacteraceae bacterium]|jgi:hypothetical protein|nr:YdgA family protein [Campylobacteraceae bacterium]